MYRDQSREYVARIAADTLRVKSQLPLPFASGNNGPIGLILGTGWGDVLQIENPYRISLADIPGFGALTKLEGHARELMIGRVSGRQVLVLRGRIHLNEVPADPELFKMVRLQVEMLLQLGACQLILTSAVGALRPQNGAMPLSVGDVCAIDGFVTLFAPDMPLWAGEFCSPEDTLNLRLREIALAERGELRVSVGGHVMVRGPFFEGRRYDKRLLAQTGASVVGMSILPEACVAALYGARVLALGFVTNSDIETHSHETNLAQAKSAAAKLGGLLERIVRRM